jgi:hypothetical protein
VACNSDLVELVHAGPAEVTVGDREARGLDNMGRHIQARTQAQNRSGVLGDIRLEKRNLHDVAACEVLMKCLNNRRLARI